MRVSFDTAWADPADLWLVRGQDDEDRRSTEFNMT